MLFLKLFRRTSRSGISSPLLLSVVQFQPEITTDRMLRDFPSLSSKSPRYVMYVATDTGALEIVYFGCPGRRHEKIFLFPYQIFPRLTFVRPKRTLILIFSSNDDFLFCFIRC
jgi:hypothetical protein